MYSSYPNLILGFHGTDKKVADKVIRKEESLTHKKNPYDWLGHGVYFWESNPERAFEFATELKERGKIDTPAVVGAVLDLGHCLNLLDSKYLKIVEEAYSFFKVYCDQNDKVMPENEDAKGNTDLLLRYLDCSVIETVHAMRKKTEESLIFESEKCTLNERKIRAFDSIRGAFIEGKPLYNGAGFKKKNHIQICIRNFNCIKGLFYPLQENNECLMP